MRSIFILVLLPITFAITGCGDDGGSDAEPYPTLQECFDDHTMTEGLPVGQAIVVCCIDHPIAGVHPSCGADKAACATIVRAALSAATTTADITTACADYETKLGM